MTQTGTEARLDAHEKRLDGLDKEIHELQTTSGEKWAELVKMFYEQKTELWRTRATILATILLQLVLLVFAYLPKVLGE